MEAAEPSRQRLTGAGTMRTLLAAACAIHAAAARQQELPESMRLPCPLTEPEAVAALLSAASCPCDSASLCDPVKKEHEKEVFGFGAGTNSTWSHIDWEQVTTIAWSTDPQLVCLAHKHEARL